MKSCVVDVDATPFRQFYESHVSAPFLHVGLEQILNNGQYAQPAFRGAKPAAGEAQAEEKKQSGHVKRILDERKKDAKLDSLLENQFKTGRLLAVITSRPGQSGRADGYILEGKELDVSPSLS